MTPQLHRLSLAFALAFLAIALTSGYWGLVRHTTLIERADNPRRVLSEQRARRLCPALSVSGALTRAWTHLRLLWLCRHRSRRRWCSTWRRRPQSIETLLGGQSTGYAATRTRCAAFH